MTSGTDGEVSVIDHFLATGKKSVASCRAAAVTDQSVSDACCSEPATLENVNAEAHCMVAGMTLNNPCFSASQSVNRSVNQ